MSKNINLENYDAVIFDFDGTLVDSLGLWNQIDIEYLGKHGFDVPEGLSEEINGMSFTETAEYFKDRFELSESIEEIKQDWIDLSNHHYLEDIPFKPFAEEFIYDLHKNSDKKIGLATSNNSFITEGFFNKHGIDFIDYFSYSCDAKKGKPAPYVFLNAAEGVGVKPERCLAFEDTIEGIQAAKAAGMTVVAVKDKWATHNEEIIRELSDYFIEDYRDLVTQED